MCFRLWRNFATLHLQANSTIEIVNRCGDNGDEHKCTKEPINNKLGKRQSEYVKTDVLIEQWFFNTK